MIDDWEIIDDWWLIIDGQWSDRWSESDDWWSMTIMMVFCYFNHIKKRGNKYLLPSFFYDWSKKRTNHNHHRSSIMDHYGSSIISQSAASS